MKYLFTLFLLLLRIASCTHYDVVVVGSGPFCLFEALHQDATGKRVLIIESSPLLGGAWKAIPTCGVEGADMGCHQIGADLTVKEFLEVYGGCQLVSLDQPDKPYSNYGEYYFSKGCRELIENLEKRIRNTSIDVWTNHTVNRVRIDIPNSCARIELNGTEVSANQMFVTPFTFFLVDDEIRSVSKIVYNHLYLLIADPTFPRFCYQGYGGPYASRMVNLTHFVGLANSGRQLVVFQTHYQNVDGTLMVEDLKSRGLLDPSAYLLQMESYSYEQWPQASLQVPSHALRFIEILNTFHFGGMYSYIPRWKQALRPYNEIIRN